jgi:hypothetical protein
MEGLQETQDGPVAESPVAAAQNRALRRLPGNKHRRQGSVMSCCSPSNVIVVNRKQGRFAARYESLPIGPEYRSVVMPQLGSSVSLRVFIEREGEGS